MYRNIVVPTLRGQKRQILIAHMSVGLVLFADSKSYCATAISSKRTIHSGYPGTIRDSNIHFRLHTSPGTWFRRQGLPAGTQRADSPGWVNPKKRNKVQGQEARCGTEVPQER
jgi:hypothetical protein